MHMFPTSSSSGDKNLGDLKSVIYVSPTFKCPYLSYFKGGGGGGQFFWGFKSSRPPGAGVAPHINMGAEIGIFLKLLETMNMGAL